MGYLLGVHEDDLLKEGVELSLGLELGDLLGDSHGVEHFGLHSVDLGALAAGVAVEEEVWLALEGPDVLDEVVGEGELGVEDHLEVVGVGGELVEVVLEEVGQHFGVVQRAQSHHQPDARHYRPALHGRVEELEQRLVAEPVLVD